LGFADDISQGLGDSIGGALFRDTEQLNQLRGRRRGIQQNLRQARAAGNVDQIRQLTIELDRVNKKIRQGATLAGRLGQAFRNFGQVAKQALQSFVSQVIAAIAKLVMAASGGFVQSTGLAVIHKGENIIPKGGAMAGGSVSTGSASLNGDTIEIPVRMINDGNRIGSRNKGRAGRA
jgi:hypothetical protein